MSARLVVVSGTGTDIGKTHFAAALLRALGTLVPRVAGLKPIESGVSPEGTTDAARLAEASSFHVKPFGYALPDAVAPHLAARRAGRTIDLGPIVAGVGAVREATDVVVVELPGGLFSPVTERLLNADFARQLQPEDLLVVVPDRLGVLHDAIVAERAADSMGLRLGGLVLVATANPDGSAGHNAKELSLFVRTPVVAELPRAAVDELARSPAVVALARRIQAGGGGTSRG